MHLRTTHVPPTCARICARLASAVPMCLRDGIRRSLAHASTATGVRTLTHGLRLLGAMSVVWSENAKPDRVVGELRHQPLKPHHVEPHVRPTASPALSVTLGAQGLLQPGHESP